MSGDLNSIQKVINQNEANKDNETVTINFDNIDKFMQNGFKTCMESIRHSNSLPAEREYDFYKAYESFNRIIDNEGNHILSLINRILRNVEVDQNIKNRSVAEKIELIVEANDLILERVSISMDEMNGLRNLPEEPVIQTVSAELPINGSWNRANKATFSVGNSIQNSNQKASSKSIHLLTAKNIIRPQKFFKDKIENSNHYPWKPRIVDKPNSLKPLALYLEETEFGEGYSHPYEIELERFTPPESQLKKCKAVIPKEVIDTPLYEITTQEQLNDLVEELRKHTEFSVDLEHHSYRSFMGITCLMQISTKDADYLIDTLALRNKLWLLNEVFTKPSIVKIFHGADMDIQWLQRDLSLYVVNMFDTHKAAKQLGYSGLSLAYLLNRFCDFMPDKQFQLADWRIRPLPEQLKSYAREDTHYLIYIYQVLRNELIKQGNGSDNILKSVIQMSTDVCSKRYFKPILTDESHMNFYRKCKRLFDNRQMFALKELYRWRDEVSREQDESTGYVLPNHMLLQISEMLPREIQGILACCNPIPPLVRANSLEIHQIILRAREQSLERAIMKDDSRTGFSKESIKLNIDSPLHCPHDLTKLADFRDDLPTLLGNHKKETKLKIDSATKIIDINKPVRIERTKAICSLFNNSDLDSELTTSTIKKDLKFLGPFERYQLVKPFIQAEEKKAKELQDAKQDKALEGEQDDPSVIDRIASLHEHFVKTKAATEHVPSNTKIEVILSSQPIEEEPTQSLIELGGTKKRKRDFSSEHNNEHNAEYETPDNELHTPVPRFDKKRKNNDEQLTNPCFRGSGSQESPRGRGGGFRGRGSRGSSPRGNKRPNDSCDAEAPKRNREDWQNTRKQRNDKQQNFKPYDYKSVDFNQFQGGASSAQQSGVKTNFRGKGNKKNSRGGKGNQNKSHTFDNAGNNRGRGRRGR